MSYKHFTQDDRNEISILLKRGYSHRDIAGALEKHHSSVSREIKNNNVNGVYDPKKARIRSKTIRSKYQCMKIVKYPELANYIEIHLKNAHWTPEEIAGRWNSENHLQKKRLLLAWLRECPVLF